MPAAACPLTTARLTRELAEEEERHSGAVDRITSMFTPNMEAERSWVEALEAAVAALRKTEA